jgi:hypothetical protein
MPATSPNWQRAFPVNTMGTPPLGFFVVDMGEDIETNYSSSNSLYAQAVRALQQSTELYMVGLPDGNFFTFSARLSTVPGAVEGATTGIITSLGATIAEVCGSDTVLAITLRSGGTNNDVGDEFEFRHASFATPLKVRVTASTLGVASAVEIVDGGVWTNESSNPANTQAGGFTRVQTFGTIDTNGTGLEVNMTSWGMGGIEVYNASIVGNSLVWND